ncbi:MAG: hypothetical protein ABEJ64_03990 [Candidatus Nanohaloarchaea archaeon]
MDEDEFINAQGSTAAVLLSSDTGDITQLRKRFMDRYGDRYGSPASVFYSSLSVMDLQDALEVGADSVELEGGFYPVPQGDWQEVEVALGSELDPVEKEEFERHFREHFSGDPAELHEAGYRFLEEEEHGTGYMVRRELGHLSDLPHTWADIEVGLEVAYLTPLVQGLVEQDLKRYAGKIQADEYRTLQERVSGEKAT